MLQYNEYIFSNAGSWHFIFREICNLVSHLRLLNSYNMKDNKSLLSGRVQGLIGIYGHYDFSVPLKWCPAMRYF